MSLLIPIVISILVAGLAPLAAFATNEFVERGRRKRAYQRLKDDPYVFIGAEIDELQIEGRETPVMRNCVITNFQVGFLEISKKAKKAVEGGEYDIVVTFTGREFEKLIPVFKSYKKARGRR